MSCAKLVSRKVIHNHISNKICIANNPHAYASLHVNILKNNHEFICKITYCIIINNLQNYITIDN